MKKLFLFCAALVAFGLNAQTKTISKAELRNKIKGGWAGQTIGVTFGGPMEFRYNGTMINGYQPIPWYDGYLKKTMLENPGLYDDLYMDLTFVEVFEREGLKAPLASQKPQSQFDLPPPLINPTQYSCESNLPGF